LPLDPVYTGKLVMAFEKAWAQGELDENKRYLLIHTGGLQGRRGVEALSEYLP
jgi:1-aminocyclopropane-1-carboxylate deaminase